MWRKILIPKTKITDFYHFNFGLFITKIISIEFIINAYFKIIFHTNFINSEVKYFINGFVTGVNEFGIYGID
jgi:hypothetical protein